MESASSLSQLPVDFTIRCMLAGDQIATASDIEQVIERMATVPFDPRRVSVPSVIEGRADARLIQRDSASALEVHLLKRIYLDAQWTAVTTSAQYLADLRLAVRERHNHVGVYVRRGGTMVAAVSQTDRVVPLHRRGEKALPNLVVLYSADRGSIISGYQFSSMGTLAMPEDVLWLR